MASSKAQPTPAAEPPRKKSPILTLSTQAQPCETVEIDNEEYEVLGFGHLSDEDEAHVMATLARYDNLSVQLVTTKDDREAVSLARKLRAKRIDLLTRLTTIPAEVVGALAPTAQVQLVRKVQEVAGLVAPDGEAADGGAD